jgi:hypothetical protein
MTMTNNSVAILIASILIGVSASFAFVQPVTPYQVHDSSSTPFVLGRTVQQPLAFVDSRLDNPEVEIDMNISPARKCSVCIGVSHSISL